MATGHHGGWAVVEAVGNPLNIGTGFAINATLINNLPARPSAEKGQAAPAPTPIPFPNF